PRRRGPRHQRVRGLREVSRCDGTAGRPAGDEGRVLAEWETVARPCLEMNTSAKSEFLRSQIFSMTLMATVQRGGVYRSGVSNDDRIQFQNDLRRRLEELADSYAESISDEIHERNIVTLADALSKDHGAALRNGRFRIGSAQKALNL